MKFTGHERDFYDPAGDGDDLDYQHARYYGFKLGRYLQADRVVGTTNSPQSWNRYTYARNNPQKYVDPTGMYITTCATNDKACQEEASNFEAARQEALQSKDEGIRNAALAYGDPGTDNGVEVSFGDPGKGRNGSAAGFDAFYDSETNSMSLSVDVTIRPGLSGTSLLEAVVHEGQHASDAQGFLGGFTNDGFDSSLNISHYESELRAYRLSHRVLGAAGKKAKYPCGSKCSLGKGVKGPTDADRRIKRLLKDPAMGYELTEQNDGGPLFSGWQ